MERADLVSIITKEVEVPVRVKKKIPKIPLGVFEVNLKEGITIDVPVRIAEVLIEKGLAEVDPEHLFTFSEINKIRWREEKTAELQPLDENFYVKARYTLKKLNEELIKKQELDPKLLKLHRIMRGLLVDIIKRRIYKIVNMALADPHPSRSLMKLMTKEERYFYVRICDILQTWENTLIKYVEGD